MPAGYALFWPTYHTESAARGGWLSDLYMLPNARRHGIARRLMAEVAARTAAWGGRYLVWLVHAENERARAFYRTLGHLPDTLTLRLSGGTARLPGLARHLGEMLGTPVELFDPVGDVGADGLAPHFVQAFGLSLRTV